jgi:hypothetical protein
LVPRDALQVPGLQRVVEPPPELVSARRHRKRGLEVGKAGGKMLDAGVKVKAHSRMASAGRKRGEEDVGGGGKGRRWEPMIFSIVWPSRSSFLNFS